MHQKRGTKMIAPAQKPMPLCPNGIGSIIVAILLLAGPVAGQSATLDKKLQARLETAAAGTELPVIVTFSDKIVPSAPLAGSSRPQRNDLVRAMRRKAEETQQPVSAFLRQQGVGKIRSLWIINALAFEARPELIRMLALRPGLEEIRLNGTVTAPAVVPADGEIPEWNISAIGADQLWALGLTGEGVVVASLDGGVDISHPDLERKWRGWNGSPCNPLLANGTRDWFDPHGEHPNCPFDKQGHGTNVMGVMVGGNAGGPAIGVAPDATWIAARIFNDAGSASYAAIHRAFQWALDPDGNGDTGDAPDIVNNSWGLNSTNLCINEFQPDIQLLKTAGIAVLFSAGNAGPDPSSSVSPANHPENISVGATDRRGNVSIFSARGPSSCAADAPLFPKLTAPGEHIRTADLTFGGAVPNAYVAATGSSLAVPHVSGIMALLLERDGFPTTTIRDLETALQLSATDLGPEGPDNNFGYGQVNALAAYRRLAGQPYLAVYDPQPPEHDLTLDFGTIPVGQGMVHDLVIRNSGGGVLTLPAAALATMAPPFAVVNDSCSGAALQADASCRIGLRFSPTEDILSRDNLNIFSNDPERNPTVIAVTGTGKINPLPPQIEFSAAGLELNFGSVAPGRSVERILTIHNRGDQFLAISRIDSSLLPPQFTVAEDGCTGASLALNESCRVVFSFAPEALGILQVVVEILANDPARSQTTITLRGIGNTPPDRAILNSPADGATDLGLPVTFLWFQPKDPDGDQVTDRVVVSQLTAAQAGGGTVDYLDIPGRGLLVAAGTILVAMAMLLGLGRKISPIAGFAILVAGILLMNSCGGGDNGAATMSIPTGRSTVTDLESGSTYTWKVVAEDGQGGVSESASWSFTTR